MMGVPLVMEAAPGEVRRPRPAARASTPPRSRAEWRAPARWPAQPARAAATDAPLAGTRAIDLAGFIAGPVVSRHLAMLGSDVVKVEPPSGDPFRAFGPMFAAWNQGKRSVALDLPAGRPTRSGSTASSRVWTWWWRTSAPAWPPGWAATTPRSGRSTRTS